MADSNTPNRKSDEMLAHQHELELQNEELRRGLSELETARSRYLDLYDLAPAGYLTLNPAGMVLEANLCAARLLGVERARLLMKPFFRFIVPEDRAAFHAFGKRPPESDSSQSCELRMVRPDASVFWARLETAAGHDSDGTPTRLVVLTDISEARAAAAGLATAEKLESLGVMAGGIAHDLNNILTALLGNLSLLHGEVKAAGDGGEILKEAETACRAAAALANQLLTFSKGGMPVMEVIDLKDVVAQAAGFAARSMNVRCVFESGPGPLKANADKAQVALVVHNLLVNAAQAMPDGGEVAVRGATAADGSVELAVSDRGEGIPPERLPHVFEPYASSRSQGRGLGLAVCQAVMTKHGGKIGVRSAPGEGAVFTLTFPPAPQAAVGGRPPPSPRAPGTGRILIMDDEAPIAKLLTRMLQLQGFQAETVSDGRAAVDAYRRAQEGGRPYDAVILDLTIPGGMGGLEALGELQKLDPDVTAVVSSGYCDDPVMSDFAARGFRGVLQKPYDAADLAKVLSRVLGV